MANGVQSRNTEKSEKIKEVKPVANRKELTQLEIDIIEARLTLNGGTLPQEFGGAIANRFGKALSEIDAATTAISYLDKIRDIDKRKKKTLETRRELEAAKLARKEEVAKYTKLAMDYIKTTYGKEVKNESNRLVGYGDSIEVLQNRHLIKTW